MMPPPMGNPHLYTEHDVYGMEYSLWPVWVNYLSVFCPASRICTLTRLGKPDSVLGLINNNWYHQGVYQHSSHPKSKTHQLLRGKINSIPAKTRTVSTPYSIPSTSCVYIYTHIDVTPSIYGLSLQSLLSSFSP